MNGSMEATVAELKALADDGDVRAEKRSGVLAARIPEAAGRRGLLDVAYSFVDSPMGRLLAVVTRSGLVMLAYPDESVDERLAVVTRAVSPRILESPPATDRVRRELDRYFEGRLRRFRVPVYLSLTKGFSRRILEETAQVPFGSVTTYGKLASKAGSPRAARAAGNALGSNPVPIIVPCHRVIHASGELGGYTGGLDRKRMLLRLEGVHGLAENR